MTREKGGFDEGSGDRGPEIQEEIKALNERAGQVGQELENTDLESLDSEERASLVDKAILVGGIIMMIGGAIHGYTEVHSQGLSFSHLEDMRKIIHTFLPTTPGAVESVGGVLFGLTLFLHSLTKIVSVKKGRS